MIPARRGRTALALAVLVAAPLLAAAPPTSRPGARPPTSRPDVVRPDLEPLTVDAILDGYVNALGGEDALRAHTTRTLRGSHQRLRDAPLSPITIVRRAPRDTVVTTAIAGFGEVRQAYVDGEAWSWDPRSGRRTLSPEQAATLRLQADFLEPLTYRDRFASIESGGLVRFNDAWCWELTCRTADGLVVREYFDVDTLLRRGTKQTLPSRMGPIPTQTVFDEYKPVDSVMIPMRRVVRAMGVLTTTRLQEVSHAPIPDEAFVAPDPAPPVAPPATRPDLTEPPHDH